MKTKPTLMLLVWLLGVFFGQQAQAFYNPSTGRWLSRDPHLEFAFVTANPRSEVELEPDVNELLFVANDTVNRLDILGGGKPYSGNLCYCTYGCRPNRYVPSFDATSGKPTMDGGTICSLSTLGAIEWRSSTSICNQRMFNYNFCPCVNKTCTFACEYMCVLRGAGGKFAWKSTGKDKLVKMCP